jgi:hypothetical protein
MKHLRITLSSLLACTALHAAQKSAQKAVPVTAHEWGTFTTLVTSQGKPLPGLFIDASPLPSFVHTLPFFAGAPAPLATGPAAAMSDSGCAAKWRGVTTKMETPVIYFYHDETQSLALDVKARFPNGTIHQFYPPREDGETNPTATHVDFGQPREGHIEWKAEILPQKLNEANYTLLTHPSVVGSQEWVAPRRPQSNLVKSRGEVESYLFYRGLAGILDLPLKLRFTADSTLEMTNPSIDTIHHVVVYDQTYSASLVQAGTVWWQGRLLPKETRTLTLNEAKAPKDNAARESAFQAMRAGLLKGLQDAGLTLDEASAMLSTWERSYWGDERGFKVFWIVPRPSIDSILPLTITSATSLDLTLERAFIARSEILMPYFERTLREGDYADPQDRHRLAFEAFLSAETVELSGFPRTRLTSQRNPRMTPVPGSFFTPWGHRNLMGQKVLPLAIPKSLHP